jgi:hypothetical protein
MAEKKVKESKIKGNSLGASGFTLAILSVLTLGLVGAIMGLIGGIFCFVQQKKKPTKLAKAGLILSIIGFILSIVYVIWIAPWLTKFFQSSLA